MKSVKGVSMISLIIAIVVIVILIGIATTAGYRYITESDRVKAEAVTSVIGEAAYRRQNDLATGVAEAYYEGYSFKVDGYNNGSRYAQITGLPLDDKLNASGEQISDNIPDCLQGTGAKWYLIDSDSAQALGVQESDKFLARNISYPASLDEDEVTVVLADYSSGKGYLISMSPDIIKDSIRIDTGCLNSPTGNHNYKIIATCTKPAMCIYCGEIDELTPALGHDFANATCTSSAACRRCGEIDPNSGPLGHLMISNADVSDTALIKTLNDRDCRIYVNTDGATDSSTTAAWITDAVKHWHECIRCGEKSDEKEHIKGEVSLDSEYHYSMCSECGWESVKSKHSYTYTSVTENTHKRICKICSYEETHNDTGWKDGHAEYHYRLCQYARACYNDTLVINGITTDILFKEAHYDKDYDLYCDACGHALDKEPPLAFESNLNSYGKMIESTTNSITVEAYTTDEGVGVDYYQFGFVNSQTGNITWSEKVYPSGITQPAQKTYNDLKADTEYTIYVKATDKAGNTTAPYKIPNTNTGIFPIFNGLTNIPDEYVKGPINVGIAPIETDLTDIVLKYSLDNGTTWKEIAIENISTATITLTKEKETILIKFVDKPTVDATKVNESGVWEVTVEKIDTTPPVITIEAKNGTDTTQLAMYHTANVIVSDKKAGIAPNTEIRYAWSQSNTVVPTNFEATFTENWENAEKVSFEVVTPKDANGIYYLWIDKGLKDRVGNETTVPVCSDITFVVDSQDVKVSNIRMEDLSPAVEKEYLFVKTGGMVTISFEVDKKLGEVPVVKLNNHNVSVSSTDGVLYRGTITITDSFEEGELQLQISNIISESGKLSNEVYTNDDLVFGPVIYDRTNPTLEYISKK